MDSKPKFEGLIPPVIVDLPSGRFAVSGSTWIPVGAEVTLDEVRTWWNKPVSEAKKERDRLKAEAPTPQTWNVPSSTGKGSYTVTRNASGLFSCTCPAYEFSGRKNICKHVHQIKYKLDVEKMSKQFAGIKIMDGLV